MAENKKNLPVTDDQKASSISPEASLIPTETKKKVRKAPKVKKQKKKGFPIVLDILIMLLLVGVIGAAAWGVWTLGKYFATQYIDQTISYTLLVEDVDADIVLDKDGACVIKPDSKVYLADAENGHLMGTVTSVSIEKDEQTGSVDIYVNLKASAGYNSRLGYFIEQTKIAVGKSYDCRFEGLWANAVIVELQTLAKE